MQFSPELRPLVAGGAVTVSFRLWTRPQVKVGGRYAVGDAVIEVDSLELEPFSEVDEADVRRAGERDRETLRRRAAHAGQIAEDTPLFRVEFHVVDLRT